MARSASFGVDDGRSLSMDSSSIEPGRRSPVRRHWLLLGITTSVAAVAVAAILVFALVPRDSADAQIRDQVRLALELDVHIRELPDGYVPGRISAEQAATLKQSVEARLVATIWFDGQAADLRFDGPAQVSGQQATISGSYTSRVRMYHMQDGVREDEVSVWPMHFVATLVRTGDHWLVSNIVSTFATPPAAPSS